MDSKGRNVIVCDNGTGVRIESFLKCFLIRRKMDAFVYDMCVSLFWDGPLHCVILLAAFR